MVHFFKTEYPDVSLHYFLKLWVNEGFGECCLETSCRIAFDVHTHSEQDYTFTERDTRNFPSDTLQSSWRWVVELRVHNLPTRLSQPNVAVDEHVESKFTERNTWYSHCIISYLHDPNGEQHCAFTKQHIHGVLAKYRSPHVTDTCCCVIFICRFRIHLQCNTPRNFNRNTPSSNVNNTHHRGTWVGPPRFLNTMTLWQNTLNWNSESEIRDTPIVYIYKSTPQPKSSSETL